MATLPSSPPQMTRSRSRSPSDYSLDLDALLPDGSSEIATPSPKKHAIDVVHSEDIDGPTDFTQNLEYWMTAKLPNVTRPSKLFGQARHDLEQYVSDEAKDPESDDAEHGNILSTGTVTPKKDNVDGPSLLSNPSSSSPLPIHEGSTPKTVEYVPMKRDLQASVEDHSDTPSRIMESSSAMGATLRSPAFTLESKPAVASPPSHQGVSFPESQTIKDLEDMLKKLRLELDDVKGHWAEEKDRTRTSLDQALREKQQAHQKETQRIEESWQQRIAEQKLDADQKLSAQRSACEQLLSKVTDLNSSLKAEFSRRHELEERLKDQEDALSKVNEKLRSQQQRFDTAIEDHASTVADKGSQIARLALEHNEMKAQLKNSQDALIDAERKARTLEADLSDAEIKHLHEVEALNSRLDDAAAQVKLAVMDEKKASQAVLAEFELDNARLHEQLDHKDDEVDSLKAQLRTMQQTIAASKTADDQASIKLKEQKALNDQAAREILSLRSAKKILESRLADAEKKIGVQQTSFEALESQLAEANAARLEADAEVDEARSEVAEARKEASEAKAELIRMREDNELVNAAVDKRMKELMRLREAEWTKRMERLKIELGFRGDVLMREWGVKEMGLSEPQAYRYKFV